MYCVHYEIHPHLDRKLIIGYQVNPDPAEIFNIYLVQTSKSDDEDKIYQASKLLCLFVLGGWPTLN